MRSITTNISKTIIGFSVFIIALVLFLKAEISNNTFDFILKVINTFL